MTAPGDRFEAHRAHLIGVAYRMLGSYAEAEDAVQDTYMRWCEVAQDDIVEPRAYLTRVVSRIALDRLTSARARRETYVGTWLPEPVLGEQVPGPDVLTEYAQDLSMALMLTLERLSPLERAAFLLHDVFDVDFAAVALTLGRSEAAIRQLAARAREHVKAGAPRYTPAPDEGRRLAERFGQAILAGDLGALASHLSADVVFYSDGGGKRNAALNPIYGRDKVMRFIFGTARKRDPVTPDNFRVALVNGMPGFLLRESDGTVETIALELDGERIVAFYATRNPDKLAHLRWPETNDPKADLT